MPPPVPPSVKDGRMIAGNEILLENRLGLIVALGDAAGRHGEPDAMHRLPEQLSILGNGDRVGRRADQLDAVLVQHAALRQRHGDVERGLAAHRRQDRVGTFAIDDQLHELRRHGLDVRPIRELRIGHDRRRIRVDQDDLEPLFLERFGRLSPGIIEFGRLTDDDRTGADHENTMQVSPSRHW
jgi:hypothetical protein